MFGHKLKKKISKKEIKGNCSGIVLQDRYFCNLKEKEKNKTVWTSIRYKMKMYRQEKLWKIMEKLKIRKTNWGRKGCY